MPDPQDELSKFAELVDRRLYQAKAKGVIGSTLALIKRSLRASENDSCQGPLRFPKVDVRHNK
ncbi:hypothetical protein ASE07_14000 [Noviherbaspirillum sp. Root189]|nr:hypothetical protein ASE07_14000 [Noviherbaspirillum sp. Root189]